MWSNHLFSSNNRQPTNTYITHTHNRYTLPQITDYCCNWGTHLLCDFLTSVQLLSDAVHISYGISYLSTLSTATLKTDNKQSRCSEGSKSGIFRCLCSISQNNINTIACHSKQSTQQWSSDFNMMLSANYRCKSIGQAPRVCVCVCVRVGR